MKNWSVLLAVLFCAVSIVRAEPFEFGIATALTGRVIWNDKDGQHDEQTIPEYFGIDRSQWKDDRQLIVLMNTLSQNRWELVSSLPAEQSTRFLFKRDLAGNNPAKKAAAPASPNPEIPKPAQDQTNTRKLPLVFTGGHDTDPKDGGRPVVLVAAGLNVPTEVFREAFSHVTPAQGGREPEPSQVRKNKDALMSRLSKYGVTNDRLDEVSNYYRYQRGRGEMWRNTPAEGYASVRDGKVVGVTITNPGSGYSSPPTVTVQGLDGVELTAALSFGTDLQTNGSIKQVTQKRGDAAISPDSH